MTFQSPWWRFNVFIFKKTKCLTLANNSSYKSNYPPKILFFSYIRAFSYIYIYIYLKKSNNRSCGFYLHLVLDRDYLNLYSIFEYFNCPAWNCSQLRIYWINYYLIYIYIYIYIYICVCVCVCIIRSSQTGVGNNSIRTKKNIQQWTFKFSWAQCNWNYRAIISLRKKQNRSH